MIAWVLLAHRHIFFSFLFFSFVLFYSFIFFVLYDLRYEGTHTYTLIPIRVRERCSVLSLGH